jgi:hypothetical protein
MTDIECSCLFAVQLNVHEELAALLSEQRKSLNNDGRFAIISLFERLQTQNNQLAAENVRLKTELESLKSRDDELNLLKTFISDKFEAFQYRRIEQNIVKRFDRITETLTQNHQDMKGTIRAFATSVDQVGERLDRDTHGIHGHIKDFETDNSSAFGKLHENINSLAKTVQNIQSIGSAASKTPHSSQPSFASVLKRPKRPVTQPQPDHSLLIYPKSATQTSDKTKQDLIESIDPVGIKVGINSLRKIRNGGVIIKAGTDRDISAIQAELSSSSIASDYNIRAPKKRNPRMRIFHAPVSQSRDTQDRQVFDLELLKAIHKQNEPVETAYPDFEAFEADIRIVLHQNTTRKESQHLIIETSPKLRKVLSGCAKLKIIWSICEVQDFILVTRCFKCHGFGHLAKNCEVNDETCGHCAGAHKSNICPQKADKSKHLCVNCSHEKARSKNSNINANHTAYDDSCPMLQRHKAEIFSRTDYE